MEVRVAVIAIAIVAVANFPVMVSAPGWWDDLLGTGTGTGTGTGIGTGTGTGTGKVNPNAGPKEGDFVNRQIGQLTATAFRNSDLGKSLSQGLDGMAKIGDVMESSLNKMSRFFATNGNALLGECDAPELIKLIRPKLKLNSIPFKECLRSFKVALAGATPTMRSGRLIYDETNFNIDGFTGGGNQGDSKEFYISFEFTDLHFTYDFKNDFLLKNGQVVFKVAGTSKVKLRVRVPVRSEQLKALAKEDSCFVDVREVIVELQGKLEVSDIQYNSLVQNNTNKGLTKSSVRMIANDPKISKKIIEIVKTSLKKMMEPVINDGAVFCDEKQVTTAEAPQCEEKDIIDLSKDNAPVQ